MKRKPARGDRRHDRERPWLHYTILPWRDRVRRENIIRLLTRRRHG